MKKENETLSTSVDIYAKLCTFVIGLIPFFFYANRFVETKRYMDFISPGSQAKEGSFFGLEAALEGLEPG